MTKSNTRSAESLLQQGAWGKARELLERELKRKPDDHWLLTQLGVTYYDQGRYRDALPPLLSSLEIVRDCPLTLWNVAGVVDAIGKPEAAVPIYTWLLGSKKSAADDPCWESQDWADALRTDCVFRVGVCFQHMGRGESAEHCFRQYINLVLAGMTGTYPVDDAARHIRELHGDGPRRPGKEVRDAITSTLRDAGGRRKLPKLSLADLLAT